ncbi:hypothetical protein [Ensifer sp. YR511]|uniref:hypothetical protein n=1 Tax=Ensifer sp. YR511 TaxID=1855294 RepID=UPI00088F50B0|nr:hypothetical protein [Ensifer sp. YR511]SDN18256.1 hypothetical protein SAMN05216328_12087 [Ensifer sp. YR511]
MLFDPFVPCHTEGTFTGRFGFFYEIAACQSGATEMVNAAVFPISRCGRMPGEHLYLAAVILTRVMDSLPGELSGATANVYLGGSEVKLSSGTAVMDL